ncbi:MAG TPA: methylmalonyl Co-A mutase-associated GTPase MeaB [Fervidobacterium sp.]|nr:methylmalonyl Co-A mutase-associated GTPase MeaB [Fervidobacterium sp.]
MESDKSDRLVSSQKSAQLEGLLERLRKGDQIALAKAISLFENDPELIFYLQGELQEILAQSKSHIVGVTGSPGAGKSTLTDAYVSILRREGKRVGIIAVDPSSPFTGGALLGDRIRMKRHFSDDGVFIRSMGSRGNVGGLNDSVFGVIMLYKLYGFDYIIIETVGAGQSEVDIAYVADTVVLVLSPSSGDEIQLMKAGIMEIADVFVVNKADMDGAELLKMNLETVLNFSEVQKPIVMSVATSGRGIDELYQQIEKHRIHLYETGEISQRASRRMKKHAETILDNRIQSILQCVDSNDVNVMVNAVLDEICKSRFGDL